MKKPLGNLVLRFQFGEALGGFEDGVNRGLRAVGFERFCDAFEVSSILDLRQVVPISELGAIGRILDLDLQRIRHELSFALDRQLALRAGV